VCYQHRSTEQTITWHLGADDSSQYRTCTRTLLTGPTNRHQHIPSSTSSHVYSLHRTYVSTLMDGTAHVGLAYMLKEKYVAYELILAVSMFKCHHSFTVRRDVKSHTSRAPYNRYFQVGFPSHLRMMPRTFRHF